MTKDERLTTQQMELVAAGIDRIVAMIEADAQEFESQPESVREIILTRFGIDAEELAKDRAGGIKGFRAAAAGVRLYASMMATNTDGVETVAEAMDLLDGLGDFYRKLKDYKPQP